MIPSEQAERKRFELWYNNHYDMELITGPDDVEAAWEIWKAAIDGATIHAVGYVGLTSEGEPTKFRTGNFGSGHPVYLSPVVAAPQPDTVAVPNGWELHKVEDEVTTISIHRKSDGAWCGGGIKNSDNGSHALRYEFLNALLDQEK